MRHANYMNRHDEVVPWVERHPHATLPRNWQPSVPQFRDDGSTAKEMTQGHLDALREAAHQPVITREMMLHALHSQPNWWERYLTWHRGGRGGPIPI